jgi:hypothetical protein
MVISWDSTRSYGSRGSSVVSALPLTRVIFGVRSLGIYRGNRGLEDVRMKKFSSRGIGGLALPANKQPSATVGSCHTARVAW